MSNPNILVTRDSIRTLLNDPRPEFVMHVVGKALVGIFNNQTSDEQASNQTSKHNNIGFSGSDARSGSLTAKSYLKYKRLLDWQVERWTRIQPKTGYPKLCKYHNQLNQIALDKRENKHA